MSTEPLLRIENLRLYYRTNQGTVKAVDDINFAMNRNEAVVILGESGCGKTSLTRALLRLLPKNIDQYSGKVLLDGINVMEMNEGNFRRDVRWSKISMVPQAAMNSLNPVMRIEDQIIDGLIDHGIQQTRAEQRELVHSLLEHVGLDRSVARMYPHELSGGMKQRVGMATATARLSATTGVGSARHRTSYKPTI